MRKDMRSGRSMTERIPLTVRSQLRSVLFAVRNVNRPPVDTDIPSSEVGWVPVARRKLADNRTVYVWPASLSMCFIEGIDFKFAGRALLTLTLTHYPDWSRRGFRFFNLRRFISGILLLNTLIVSHLWFGIFSGN